ncbi:shisa family member 2a [Paramormyrops kingsleyae]|uniref:Shisa family member 2a n=1 Tax=Paramormyrops kingsleyae TaxID=1676925 RepID=A0A3B3SSB4_9TELE|nr:protein shisa-1-like [Paramormyrops kingsleyae]
MPVYFLVSLYLLSSGLQPHAAAGTGEYCHGWADAFSVWHRGFQCPERYDGEDARYCCGTCALRYCCTAAEARLDQSACDNDDFMEFENDGKTTKKPSHVPTYLPFLIVAGTFVSFVVVGSMVAICCCQCLKPKSGDSQSGSAPIQSCLLEPGGHPSDGMTPSRNSSTSSNSTGRSMAAGRQQNAGTLGTEVAVNVFRQAGSGYPVSGAQSQQYMSPPQPPGPYFQPYLNYGIPPEHTMLVPQAFLDNCSTYGQQQTYPFQHNPIHSEPLYSGITV